MTPAETQNFLTYLASEIGRCVKAGDEEGKRCAQEVMVRVQREYVRAHAPSEAGQR